jgi:hypothetical protein
MEIVGDRSRPETARADHLIQRRINRRNDTLTPPGIVYDFKKNDKLLPTPSGMEFLHNLICSMYNSTMK